MATPDRSGRSAPRNPRPSASDIDQAIERNLAAFDAVSRVIRDGASALHAIALTLNREHLLAVLVTASKLREAEREDLP